MEMLHFGIIGSNPISAPRENPAGRFAFHKQVMTWQTLSKASRLR